MRLLAEGTVDVDVLTTDVVGLAEVPAALERMQRQEVTKILVEPGTPWALG